MKFLLIELNLGKLAAHINISYQNNLNNIFSTTK